MPRQPIIDAHEWINEISAVPECKPVKPQARERSCADVTAGKEDPFEFDANLQLCSVMGGVAQVGGCCFVPGSPGHGADFHQ